MPSSVQRKRVRKSPAARRAEIVAAAAQVALTEGLECITLRRIAEDLDVRPGLISHYFPSAEELVAEAFGRAAGRELDALLPNERAEGSPARYLARFFALATGAAYDDVSRLWINARHLSRYRPALRERVGVQEAAWRERFASVIEDGVRDDGFRTDSPLLTAIHILVVLDGLGAQANSGTVDRPQAVAQLAVTTAERELGLENGTLSRLADKLTEADLDRVRNPPPPSGRTAGLHGHDPARDEPHS
ncbi:TetR family transcriptional regulator C-terminal domain-containing protein [Streptomyces sp. LHD-70]|uniref:TetR/AcrR family transcriptional regulator n=1 Tax=Streptomyces sp. LHD-70 TaxID=3072140 RepID=UPI0028108647|nr:TetR family transcriptional regulator C-terminal domain-containing protein [Streptomyces sp. LHD-70]MDQ8702930.1 TetR family transcriptional regulator C-terminal domain-containing protein [Streptomyces sp. LHD-70]